MPWTTDHGPRLAYEAAGDHGAPVLLIIGFAVPSRLWSCQVERLAPHHRVARYDNRGAGQSEKPPGPYSMALLASDALRVMDTLGWDDAHVVGVSMGGMIAQHVALDHRRRVRSLTLIATHPGGRRALIPHLSGARAFIGAQRGTPDQRFEAIKRLLYPNDFLASTDQNFSKALREALRDTAPAASRRAQFAAILKHDTRPRLRELAGLPTLIVKPGRDILVRPSLSDRLHQGIPGSRLLVFPEAGHGIIRQCADPLAAALRDHFDRADAGAPTRAASAR